MRFCWFLIKCSLLAGLVGGALAIPQLLHRVDELARKRFQARLAEHYPGLKVRVRAAELVEGRGIVVRGVSIVDPNLEEPFSELVHLEEVYLTCPTNLEELLKGEPCISSVVIRRATLRPLRLADGSWSTARLLPLPHTQDRPPEIRIEKGTIELACGGSSTSTLRDLNLTLSAPDEEEIESCLRRFEGEFTGDLVRGVKVEGQWDPLDGRFTVCGTAASLELSSELNALLPDDLASRLQILRGLRAEAAIEFDVSYDPQAERAYDFTVCGHVSEGRFEDARLPHPLSDLSAAFTLDAGGIVVKDLTARCSQAGISLSCRREGYDEHSPMELHAEVRDLELDQSLAEVLPEPLRGQWYKYLPSGQVTADVGLFYDGSRWQPQIVLQCLNVSFTYHKFPYRLEHARGTLELKDDVLTASLTGYSGSQAVRVAAEVKDAMAKPYGWVTARGEKLQIDEKLLDAIPPRARAVVRSLEPRGAIDFYGKVWRDGPDDPVHRQLVAELQRCGMCYENFRYPISNIRGTLEMLDDSWIFHGLEGTNDTGRIACNGYLNSPAEGNELHLWLEGISIPLEEELRDALPSHMQQVWNDFKPQGMVDLRDTEIAYTPQDRRFSVSLSAQPRSENASIQSVQFPYRLEKLQGTLTYRDGQVRLSQFRGEHGNVCVLTDGEGGFSPDGSWQFRFDNLTVERLRFDREFVQTLPDLLKRMVGQLNPVGMVILRGGYGGITLKRGGNPGNPLTSRWDLAVDFQQASVDFGIKLDNMHGAMRLAGEHDGSNFRCRGQLDLDAMSYRDVQFTRVRGPMWIDNEQVLFGAWVDRPLPGEVNPEKLREPPQSVSAELFGGKVLWDGWVALGTLPRYSFYATLHNAELARCAQDMIPGRQELKAKMDGKLEIQGAGKSLNSLTGRGNLRLRDADIYELPMMISLLKILSIRRPDKTAFSSSDIDFHLEHNRVYFDRLNFNGDAISLVGRSGEMDFQGNVNLVFHSLVGRGDRNVLLLRDVLGEASQQIMEIEVSGPLENPEMRRKPFPGVNQALQQLQAEREGQRRLGPLGLLPDDRSAEADSRRKLPKRR